MKTERCVVHRWPRCPLCLAGWARHCGDGDLARALEATGRAATSHDSIGSLHFVQKAWFAYADAHVDRPTHATDPKEKQRT